jgi:hypothetical protein
MANQITTRREPISLAIKDEIRSYHQGNDKLGINEIISWSKDKYGITLLPATMRTILYPKPKKNPLWTGLPTASAERQRDRAPNWPELETELSKWYSSLPVPPKGQQLKEKATELWQQLSPKCYTGQKLPIFGDSWRDKFKERHGFKQRKDLPGGTSLNKEGFSHSHSEHASSLDASDTANINVSMDVDDEILVFESASGKHAT